MKHLIRFAAIAVISLPLMTSAATTAELQAQAQALLQQVAALQAQLAAQTGGAVTPTSGAVTVTGTCPLTGVSLRLGSTGDAVSRLQQFLARDSSVYPEAQVSGYFGSLTQAAVQRWQAKYNIVTSGTPDTTGYGVVGPRTAAAMSLQCAGSVTGTTVGSTVGGSVAPAVGGFIQVSPISGNAPLSVKVTATVNTVNSCGSAIYTLDFGDGSIPQAIATQPNACASFAQTFAHLYLYGGIYIVKLSAGGHETTATVVVSGPSAPSPNTNAVATSPITLTASPTSGAAPLAVSFSASGGNAAYSGGVSINFGDGSSATLCGAGATCGQQSLSHTYQGSGTFQATMVGTSGGVSTTLATASITTSPSSYTPFSLTPQYGGNALAAQIQFAYAQSVGYTLTWGDGSTGQATCASTADQNGLLSCSATHTYSGGGNYTVSLKRGSQIDTASLTITN